MSETVNNKNIKLLREKSEEGTNCSFCDCTGKKIVKVTGKTGFVVRICIKCVEQFKLQY